MRKMRVYEVVFTNVDGDVQRRHVAVPHAEEAHQAASYLDSHRPSGLWSYSIAEIRRTKGVVWA